jgi:hypothetical protein
MRWINILIVGTVRNPLAGIKSWVCLKLIVLSDYLTAMDLGSSSDTVIITVAKGVTRDTIIVAKRIKNVR